MRKLLFVFVLVLFNLLFSACSNNVNSSSEKMAVIRWDKAISAHPEYPRLEQGEKIVKSLVLRRDAQAELGRSQLGSLQHLRGLKQISEQSYLQAELQTKLLEKEQVGQSQLRKELIKVEKEADKYIAPIRAAVEEEYRLRIFNLRLEKDRAVTTMRPSQAEKVKASLVELDKQIFLLIKERESRLQEVEQERQAFIAEKMSVHVDALREELRQLAEEGKIRNQEIVAVSEGKYDKMMAAAPESLTKALAIMDKEIDKQQDKNKLLKEKIDKDTEELVVKLANKRGYTIVFNTFKANVSADDITNDIIAELKKLKDK